MHTVLRNEVMRSMYTVHITLEFMVIVHPAVGLLLVVVPKSQMCTDVLQSSVLLKSVESHVLNVIINAQCLVRIVRA